MASLVHGARVKARIEQMQNRMFDPTNILIDRQPIFCSFSIYRISIAGRMKAYASAFSAALRRRRVALAARRVMAATLTLLR